MEEKWRDIKDYEKYEISNLGRVRNKQTVKIIKPWEHPKGYVCVTLRKGEKKKRFLVHRLVAEAFIPNPGNLPQINHRDENKKNNCVTNLEFCTASYNNTYGTRMQKIAKKLSKQVLCIETGEVFASLADVERKKGYFYSNISRVCNGKRETAYSYHWQFV